MATNPEQDEYLDEDERDDIAQRSIFSAGWFRALLVLTVLAIVVVVSLPYLLNWLEPTPTTAPKPQTKASEPARPRRPRQQLPPRPRGPRRPRPRRRRRPSPRRPRRRRLTVRSAPRRCPLLP